MLRRRPSSFAAVVAVAAALAVVAACRSAEAPAPPVQITFAKSPSSASASAAPLARPSRPSRPIEDPPDPEAQTLFRKLLEQPAIPLSDEPPPKVTARALENTARGEAHGMKADGPAKVALLGEGQRASRPVKLPAGACATFLAEGGLGVGELDLFLATGDGASVKVLVEDHRGGPVAVIGGHDGCWPVPQKTPLDAELHVVVRRGQGVVLVQGFVR